ncbi:MAG: class I SAM-dependent methyltransferase [Candidatus Glassbacteria bacterium]|nr:class I SAM-dependent methyltransferase [Candidatus Glassbacteria bacterium]
MGWYKKAFGAAYLNVYSHRDDKEAGKAAAVIRRAMGPLAAGSAKGGLDILDLCCGQGRYSLLLAAEGHRVVGLDLSAELLGIAGSRWESTGAGERKNPGRLSLVRADMRRIPFVSAFDLLINMFTSFGYFERDADNQAVLDSAGRALRPGGRFLIDYLNRVQVLDNLVGEDSFENGGYMVRQSRSISPDGLRVEKTVLVRGRSGEERYRESVRLFTRQEMQRMLERAGLRVEELFGDFDCSAWSPGSPRLILTGYRNG